MLFLSAVEVEDKDTESRLYCETMQDYSELMQRVGETLGRCWGIER